MVSAFAKPEIPMSLWILVAQKSRDIVKQFQFGLYPMWISRIDRLAEDYKPDLQYSGV